MEVVTFVSPLVQLIAVSATPNRTRSATMQGYGIIGIRDQNHKFITADSGDMVRRAGLPFAAARITLAAQCRRLNVRIFH